MRRALAFTAVAAVLGVAGAQAATYEARPARGQMDGRLEVARVGLGEVEDLYDADGEPVGRVRLQATDEGVAILLRNSSSSCTLQLSGRLVVDGARARTQTPGGLWLEAGESVEIVRALADEDAEVTYQAEGFARCR